MSGCALPPQPRHKHMARHGDNTQRLAPEQVGVKHARERMRWVEREKVFFGPCSSCALLLLVLGQHERHILMAQHGTGRGCADQRLHRLERTETLVEGGRRKCERLLGVSSA